ncbi:MAG: VCBS repeat-containing protein [Acidobacteriota bacterium]
MKTNKPRDWTGLLARIKRRDSGEDAAELGPVIAQDVAVAAAEANPVGVWGYPDTFSFNPGETMRLHVSSSSKFAGVRIYRLTDWKPGGWTSAPLREIPPVEIAQAFFKPNNPEVSGVEDWNWPQNINVPIDGAWPTGIYVAEIGAYPSKNAPNPTTTAWAEFVIKNPQPGTGARILYKLNLNTVQAYNLGMQDSFPTTIPPFDVDLYNNVDVSPRHALPAGYKITYRRPVWMWAWNNKSVTYDYPMLKWLAAQGYEADFCTDVDLHLDTNQDMLSRYKLLLSMGHDEYWSEPMRAHCVAFRDGGGDIAFLSGNTVCWRVHFQDVDPALGIPTSYVCDKGPTPLCDTDGPDAWWKCDPVNRENGLVGVGTRNCAIRLDIPSGPFSLTKPPSPGFKIQNADHWVLKDTGLLNGDNVGVGNVNDKQGNSIIENLIGYEGGGARIEFNPDGSARATFTDGTPQNFVILGVAETAPYESACARSQEGNAWWAFSREDSGPGRVVNGVYAATMGVYESNGIVFTGSTVHWANILNEWDTDGGAFRDVPQQWHGQPQNDPQGHPILGNQYLHRITRNVIDAALNDQPGGTGGGGTGGGGTGGGGTGGGGTGGGGTGGGGTGGGGTGGGGTGGGGTGGGGEIVVGAVAAVAVGDLNGDGKADLILQVEASGDTSYSLLDGIAQAGGGSIAAGEGKRRRVVGIGSLTAADSLDMLVQDKDDGHLECWSLEFTPNDKKVRRTNSERLADDPGDTLWRAVALLDLNGDGRPDLLFQNQQDGSLFFWILDGITLIESGPLAPDFVPGDLTWRVVAALDLNGDGKDDLLFQNETDGSLFFWLIDGVERVDSGPIDPGDAGLSWPVVGSGDVDGDGVKEIVFQNRDTGAMEYRAIQDFTLVSLPPA